MKPKVTLVVKYFAPMKRPSGILNFVFNLSEELGKIVDLTVVTWRFDDSVPKEEQKNNYRIIRVSGSFLLKSSFAVRKIKPDVIIFGTGIYRIFILIPYLLIFRLITLGAPIIVGQYGTMENKFAFLGHLLKPLLSKLIATNQEIDAYYRQTLGSKVTYIPPAVDIARLGRIKKAKDKIDRPVVGFFGHLNRDKGSEILFDAYRELKTTRGSLVIAGEGELLTKFKDHKTKNIYIYEYLTDVLSYIKSCDILVFPFRNQVTVLGLSLSAMEAMAMGKPLLVTDNPCLAPLVEDGKNGYIFKDKEDLKIKLNKLIQSEELVGKMGESSSRLAIKYDIKNIATQYKELIKELNATKE